MGSPPPPAAVSKDEESKEPRMSNIVKHLVALDKEMEGHVYFQSSATKNFIQASKVWNAGVGPPLAVVQVACETDVQKALPVLVSLKSRFDFPFRIRSGGHHKAGYSNVEGGAVLSVAKLNHIQLLPQKQHSSSNDTIVATLGPAVLVHDLLDTALAQHGYAGVVGACGGVAESGFVLGGGYGFQSRLYGLGMDSVQRLRIVLGNGSVVDTSSIGNDDLFWALRGAGGGNFGVVTEIDYQLHKQARDEIVVATLHGLSYRQLASFLYAIGDMESNGMLLLRGDFVVMFDDIGASSTEPDVNLLWPGGGSGPDHAKDEMDRVIEYALSVAKQDGEDDTLSSVAMNVSYVSVGWSASTGEITDTWEGMQAQAWTGFLYPENNTRRIWNHMMDTISAGLLDSTSYILPDIELWGGAISQVDPNATAFPHRKAVYNVGVLLMVPIDIPDAKRIYQDHVAKVNSWWPKVSQYLTGVYLNYPMESLKQEEYARAYWGDNLERLVNIKKQYDPNNSFRFEQSIPI